MIINATSPLALFLFFLSFFSLEICIHGRRSRLEHARFFPRYDTPFKNSWEPRRKVGNISRDFTIVSRVRRFQTNPRYFVCRRKRCVEIDAKLFSLVGHVSREWFQGYRYEERKNLIEGRRIWWWKDRYPPPPSLSSAPSPPPPPPPLPPPAPARIVAHHHRSFGDREHANGGGHAI